MSSFDSGSDSPTPGRAPPARAPPAPGACPARGASPARGAPPAGSGRSSWRSVSPPPQPTTATISALSTDVAALQATIDTLRAELKATTDLATSVTSLQAEQAASTPAPSPPAAAPPPPPRSATCAGQTGTAGWGAHTALLREHGFPQRLVLAGGAAGDSARAGEVPREVWYCGRNDTSVNLTRDLERG